MSLRSRKMLGLVTPIGVQITKLTQLLEEPTSPGVMSVKSLLMSQLSILIEKLEQLQGDYCTESSTYPDMKSRIASIIQEFCSMTASWTPKEIRPISDFLEKLTGALKALEDLEYFDLKQQLNEAVIYVKEMGEVNEIEAFDDIRELGESLLDMLGPLQHFGKGLVSKSLREKLALYVCQLCSAFSMLVGVIHQQHEDNLPIYNAKKYICERICWCLQAVITVFEAEPPGDDETIDHFVYKMDLALDLVSGLSEKEPDQQMVECNNLWTAVEDVFSHAMVIAQVCNQDNFTAITGVCQTIMSEYDNLKEQISSDKDSVLNSLFINTFTDALYRLERKVNIAVLGLVMEVFSEPFEALKKLVRMCGNCLGGESRSEADLSDLVEEFDQVSDRVLQVGLYAIACCNDINRVTKIKNHMASLESLESELVPSITSFYLHPQNQEMRANVKLFTAQWQLEMNKLRNAIHLIIDSSAFCQVVQDDLQGRAQKISDNLDDRQTVTQVQVQGIVQRACTLATQITTAVDDVGREKVDKQTIMTIRELKAAIFETDTASKTLLKNNPTEPQQLRVIKRCELVLNVVKRLQPALVKVMADSLDPSISESSRVPRRSSKSEGTVTFVRTPYTVKTHKPAVSIHSGESKTRVDLSCLIPYVERGRTMRTERTIIMYRTPKTEKRGNDENKNTESNKNANIVRRDLSCVRQHLFSRWSLDGSEELDLSSENWNLTEILEKLSRMSGSFSSSVQEEAGGNPGDPEDFDTRNLRDASFAGSTVGSGDAQSIVSTPERLGDIRELEEKIEGLKVQAN